MRRRGVQQGGIVDLDSSRRNRVSKANVDLDRNTSAGDGCRRADTHATIFRLLADRSRRQCSEVKRHAIIGNRLRTNGPEGFGNGLGIVVAVAKQIQISRRPERVGDPRYQEHCSFEDEAVTMR